MKVSGSHIVLSLALLASARFEAMAQTAPVRIDGSIDEWKQAAADWTDSDTDGDKDANFGRLWGGSDADYFFLAAEIGAEINLQSDNDLALYLDTDLNPTTGVSFSGIGAELVWNFGDRSGRFRAGSTTQTIDPSDIGLVTAPTVTSNFFEIALRLDAEPNGLGSLFPLDSVRVVFSDGSGGDRLPDAGQILTLPIDRGTATQIGAVVLGKELASDIRMLSYNVENDGLFATGFTNAYRRMLNGLAPDVMVFVEVRNHSADDVADRVESLYPAAEGSAWYAAGGGTDIVIVSRFPVKETFELQRANPNGLGNRAFKLDLEVGDPSELLIVAAHLPCCNEDARRQLESDEIMAFIRDAILDGTIASNAPIIIAGDLNLVGDAGQLITLISGQIVSPIYLPSFPPDWDGSDLRDLAPGTTGTPLTYTWTGQGFSPGRLDFFIFTDAVIGVGNAFALDTSELTLEELSSAGLRRSDTSVSDHLPLVADFRLGLATAVEDRAENFEKGILIDAIFPDPAVDNLTVLLRTGTRGPITIEVFDVLGRLVGQPGHTYVLGSDPSLSMAVDLPPGLYFLAVHSERYRSIRPFHIGQDR